MTFARYSRALWDLAPAKTAKTAKDEKNQKVVVASHLLSPAKVDVRMPDFSQSLAEPSPRKSAASLGFSRSSHFSRTTNAERPASDRPAIVSAWASGVERLIVMPRPESYPERAWTSLIDDAGRFLTKWSDQAASLGWENWEVWGVHRLAPWRRIGAMGLVPSLNGQKIVALSSEAAVIETGTGNRLSHYRRPADPLKIVERALIWELVDHAET